MIEEFVSASAGALLGTVTTFVVTIIRRRTGLDALTDQDHDQITAEFVAHTSAVRRQVGEYADALAGDDVVLRERLRAFESGGAP